MKPSPTRVAAAYAGNPDGKPIYPNKVDHGYEEPISGGSDVIQDLVGDLRHEQGLPRMSAPDPKRVASMFRAAASLPLPSREEVVSNGKRYVMIYQDPQDWEEEYLLKIAWNPRTSRFEDVGGVTGKSWLNESELERYLKRGKYQYIGADKFNA